MPLKSTDRQREIKLNGFRKSLILASVLLLVSTGCTTVALASSSTSGGGVPVPSLAKLDNILKTSIKQSKLPAELVPPLLKFSNPWDLQGSWYLQNSCNPFLKNSEARHPAPCWYGSASARRTVVIFGDSFVGNWIPALNIAGQKLGFRVAEFSFPGCPTTFSNPGSPTATFDKNEIDACINFHKNLPMAVNRIKPFAVIAANGEFSWGPVGDREWVRLLSSTFDQLSTATNHPIRILLGTGPHFEGLVPSCLASHPTSINRCNFSYKHGSGFNAALARDAAAISGAKVHLINTSKWVCLDGVCPAVIGNIVAYADADHLTIAISKYLSVVFEKALAPLLSIPVP